MGIKVLLVVVVVFVEVWVGNCCNKHCKANGDYSSCHMRKRRSTTLMNVMKSEHITRDTGISKHCVYKTVASNNYHQTDRDVYIYEITHNSHSFITRIGTQFSVNIEENPCGFETYDIDNDGSISKDELELKFGVKKEVTDLFAFINTKDVDAVISFPEFCAAIPQLISECKGCSYE